MFCCALSLYCLELFPSRCASFSSVFLFYCSILEATVMGITDEGDTPDSTSQIEDDATTTNNYSLPPFTNTIASNNSLPLATKNLTTTISTNTSTKSTTSTSSSAPHRNIICPFPTPTAAEQATCLRFQFPGGCAVENRQVNSNVAEY